MDLRPSLSLPVVDAQFAQQLGFRVHDIPDDGKIPSVTASGAQRRRSPVGRRHHHRREDRHGPERSGPVQAAARGADRMDHGALRRRDGQNPSRAAVAGG